MALERWDLIIRSRPNEEADDDSYFTPPEDVQGTDGVKVRYIAFRNGRGGEGVPDGFYVQTNISPQTYEASPVLRTAIRSHVVVALMGSSPSSVPGFDHGPQIDLMSGIRFSPAFMATNGALVIKIDPAMPLELQQSAQGIQDGSTDATFVPADQISPQQPR